jgi:hypothetical protein
VLDLARRERLAETLDLAVDRHRRPLRGDEADAPLGKDGRGPIRSALTRQLLHAPVVRGQQKLEGRALLDLVHEAAGRAIGDANGLACLLLEARSNLVERVTQTGGGGHDGRLIGPRGRRSDAAEERKRAACQPGQHAASRLLPHRPHRTAPRPLHRGNDR